MRIGVAGVNGRMGRMLVPAAIQRGHDLAGGTARAPEDGKTIDIVSLARICDVVVDFTHADTAAMHAAALTRQGTAWVLGTTGLDVAAQTCVETAARRIAIVQAANFSPGVTLLLALAEYVAAMLPGAEYDAEILEMHHRQKRDAPSGTAIALGTAVASGRGIMLDAVARHDRNGTRRSGDIGFAAQRGGHVVGEHALSFTSGDEQVTLAHRAFDRGVFAAGAIRAAEWLQARPPGLYSMRDVMAIGDTGPSAPAGSRGGAPGLPH